MIRRIGLLLLLSSVIAGAQQVDPALYNNMKWRLIGPFRGGRAVAVAGVRTQPNTFYFGHVAGGVWKTENAGETWTPIFDSQPIASIGAVAVAPSDPNIVYVGSGEADMRSQISHGNGIYKSTDAGKTWQHLGLADSRQIGRIVIDPKNPNVVFVAVLGHAYGANTERGIFRSTDGGASWQKVLYKDENTGGIDLALDPRDARTIYASLWQTRRPPWNVYPPSNGPGSGLYKSTDGGDTWQQLTNGIPSEGLGRIGIAVAPTEPNRVYAIVDAKQGGLYRSDDAGATWKKMATEPRIWGRGWYFGQVEADPKDANTLYVMNTSTYRSRDGGQTFTAIRGAPGGDDYHQLWINPDDPKRMVMASDQGVIVSVDGAETWSSWYNQPTAQLYHVVADNAFPFRVYGAQQDSGAIMVPSRSGSSEISFRDWAPACAGGESGMVAPDPNDPNILFGGTVTRCDQRVNQGKNVSPTLGVPGVWRQTWTLPLVFSGFDKKTLYFSRQIMWKTSDGGNSWLQISPDLTREDPGVPANLDPITATDATVAGPRKGVIYAIAPSPLRGDLVWAGTDDGLIYVTQDGGRNWRNVTPPDVGPWNKIGILEASHFDANTAYAAVDRHRLEDYQPYIYRTRDAGRTWQKIISGLPTEVYVNTVREDPGRKGLLFAGTELAVFVSFDDGDYWQSLQLNLPPSSMRDFTIHGDDLVVGTHGRSIWVLDDITPLRQISAPTAAEPAHLFTPQAAIRMRAGSSDGTPLPKGTPIAENPPTGAILDYWLKAAPAQPVTLEIFGPIVPGEPGSASQLVRRYSSADRPRAVDPRTLDIPAVWIRTPQALEATPGMHRFVWDLRYAAADEAAGGRGGGGGGGGFGGGGAGPWVLPGNTYQAKLTVDGQSYTQPFKVEMDPRVKTPAADLAGQFKLAMSIAGLQKQLGEARRAATRLRPQVQALLERGEQLGAARDPALTLDRQLLALLGAPPRQAPGGFGAPDENDHASLSALSRILGQVLGSVQSADVAPTTRDAAAFADTQRDATATLAAWNAIKTRDVPLLNVALRAANLPPLEVGQ